MRLSCGALHMKKPPADAKGCASTGVDALGNNDDELLHRVNLADGVHPIVGIRGSARLDIEQRLA